MNSAKKHVCLTVGLAVLFLTSGSWAEESYEPNWESLSTDELPEWIQDAKFGVYTHWGPYSVPAHGGPDYIKGLYGAPDKDTKRVQEYHKAKYGELKDFGYVDFIPMFTALKFNADEWVGLMHEAGAKFGGICLVHHDGFCLWDSKYTRWNARNMGPKRDIYGEIATAVRRYDDMKLLATFHHGRTFNYATGFMDKSKITPKMREELDVFDPKYADFYRGELNGGTTEKFGTEWVGKITEVIDNYQPDAIWFDGLNTAIKNNHPSEQTVCNKNAGGRFNFPDEFGLLCYENGRDMSGDVQPWFLIDRAIGYPWSYVNNKRYRDGADYHVRSIVDVVSRGGIFLLSLTPKGDGSIPEEEQEIMRGIGRWIKVNGEAIYGTRPWKIYAEGPTVLRSMKKRNNGQVAEQWDWRKQFTSEDIRFTTKANTLYAIALAWPENGKLTVRSLAKGADVNIGVINLLGHEGTLGWKQTADVLEVALPAKQPCEYAFALKITDALKITAKDQTHSSNGARQGRQDNRQLYARTDYELLLSGGGDN
jgi:alpha-L-fucosidase